MAKTIEEIMVASIEKGVEHALTKEIRPLIKENQLLKREVESLKSLLQEAIATFNAKQETEYLDDEKLLTQVEVCEMVGRNIKEVKKMIDEGSVALVEIPGGRDKILRSSVITYIQSLQIKNNYQKGILI
ncbi:MAG: hypothetical protein IKN43_11890 [Selenomonadaceae bacterium]|nr:hypothetical protein [Selenomonadaceae bacterium]